MVRHGRSNSALSVGFLLGEPARRLSPVFPGRSIGEAKPCGRRAKAIVRAERGGGLDGRLPAILVLGRARDHGAGQAFQRRTGCARHRGRRWRKGDRASGIERHGEINQPEPKRAFRHESHGCLQQSGSEHRSRTLTPCRKMPSRWRFLVHISLRIGRITVTKRKP